jgi:hypothetical protein
VLRKWALVRSVLTFADNGDMNRGYCGTTADHCAAANGCQAGFGNCTGSRTSRDLFDGLLS